ncbi:MAG: DUF4278 domain-containing protein [Limnothrix sp.]
MKLSYRGIRFNRNSAVVESTEGQTIGKYRGSELHTQEPKTTITVAQRTNLKYRGASY